MNRYKIHLIIGLVFLPFLVISSLTGFFRANHQWFWKSNYKKFKNFSYEYTVAKPLIDIDSVFVILKNRLGEDIPVSEIKLKSEIGRLLYDVRIKEQKPVLMDANTGILLSPLSKDLAKEFASQYTVPGLKLKTVYADDTYKSRKNKQVRPVYVVEYADELHTKIYIDKNSGEIEEEVDDHLKFGFWMVKLHDYDFRGTKRYTLSFAGAGLFVLCISGFYVWIKKKTKRKNKGKYYRNKWSLKS